jgi:LysM repeat protein
VAVGDQIYVVLETAWSTSSGQMQYDAHRILTGIPMTQTLCAGFASGEISDYSIPISVSTARPDGDVVHEVQYGQNLWTIAELYHVHVEDIKRLNGLTNDNIVVGWKLLVQKAATQPPPMTDTPTPELITSTVTKYPTAIPFHTTTPTLTPTMPTVPLGQQLKQNSTVVAALLIAFSILLAGIIGFGRKKEG